MAKACNVSLAQFKASPKPVVVLRWQFDDGTYQKDSAGNVVETVVPGKVSKFSTGSIGVRVNSSVDCIHDSRAIGYQLGCNLTVKHSKEANLASGDPAYFNADAE